MDTSALEQSWQRSWGNLGLQAPTGLFTRLVNAYNETHRQYHSLQHLQECIEHFSAARNLATHPGEVEIALWFHDAIYALKAGDNEPRSADWAADELRHAGAHLTQTRKVHSLIMATCHATIPSGNDHQLIADIDLAILGANATRFAEYDTQVKAEYHWVPEALYQFKRRALLQSFLDRPTIYHTEFFRNRHEQQARNNLLRAIG